MKYGRIENGHITQFPASEREWRKGSGNSMRKWADCTDEALASIGVVRVYEGSRPAISDRTQTARLAPNPALNGARWEQAWVVTDKTAEQVEAYDNQLRERIKSAAEDRIYGAFPLHAQMNLVAEMLELSEIPPAQRTGQQLEKINQARAARAAIAAIRQRSDELEAMDPIPEDPDDDRHWT